MRQQAIGQIDPKDAWAALCSHPKALLIDVRTSMEWQTIGVPDLSATGGKETVFIEWQTSPTMEINPNFAEQARDAIRAADADEVYFICRSGVRSLHAAYATAEAIRGGRDCACINVGGGFEGDPDASGKRGQINGWQAQGLPWRQD